MGMATGVILKACFLYVFIFLISFTESSYAIEISFKESINIKKPIEEVFAFAADAVNDEFWRTEVHSITTNGPFEIGTIYIEDAFLGFHYNYITKVKIKELKAPFYSIYETTSNNPFKLKSVREFSDIENDITKFTYTVFIEEALIYDILFYGVPLKLAENGYRGLMRSYLKRLKKRLERKAQSLDLIN